MNRKHPERWFAFCFAYKMAFFLLHPGLFSRRVDLFQCFVLINVSDWYARAHDIRSFDEKFPLRSVQININNVKCHLFTRGPIYPMLMKIEGL